MDQSLPGSVLLPLLTGTRGRSGKDHCMNSFSFAEEGSAQGAGTHHVKAITALVRHVVCQDTVIGPSQAQETEKETRYKQNQQNKQRYLNDPHLPSRVQ